MSTIPPEYHTTPLPTNPVDDWYLSSYARTRIHRSMISDRVRTDAYKKAIEMNRHLIKDKIVMDVGCGTGILSLFAARAGAKRVIAVECSDIADSAKQVMKDNKWDHVVTVVKDTLENIKELPHKIQKVDVIISEFMGYALFYEAMANTVIVARDRWLKPGGVILPDKCSLFIFGITDAEFKIQRIQFWEDVKVGKDDWYDFSPMTSLAMRRVWKRTLSYEKHVITNSVKLVDVDMNTVTIPALRIMKCCFTIKANRFPEAVLCHGVGTFFTVEFTKCHVPIRLSTAPFEPQTHWSQMVFFFRRDVFMEPGQELTGYFAYRHHPRYYRDIEFCIDVKYTGRNEKFAEKNLYLSC